MYGFISFIVLLLLGLVFGKLNERNHFKRLEAGEAELAHIALLNIKTVPEGYRPGGRVVSGNVVVAVDYFKVFAAGLKSLIGGRLRSYESLVERARREALLRMRREAAAMGADAVYNVRLQFSTIGQGQKRGGSGAELLAYGTAVKRL